MPPFALVAFQAASNKHHVTLFITNVSSLQGDPEYKGWSTLKKFEKVEKTGIISTNLSLPCTPSVILGILVFLGIAGGEQLFN